MVVYKFGGASVKNVEAFNHLKSIVSACTEPLVVVVSAMGKTTNKLEGIVKKAVAGDGQVNAEVAALHEYHSGVAAALAGNRESKIHADIDAIFGQIEAVLQNSKDWDFNYFYDQVVSYGEILSTLIVSDFLSHRGINNEWVDIRDLLRTDSNYRDAAVDLEATERNIKAVFSFQATKCYVTQGYIGSDIQGNTTTLGREGSDYSAALIANMLGAEQLTLWKDVAGIFNADPAITSDLTLLEKVRYQEMIEQAYYGAKVIHPKTIKPLRNKQIPLFVRCFFDPIKSGTQVNEFPDLKTSVPVTILRSDQVLISISLSDLSFISENHLSKLFELLYRFRLKANMMQHSAVSFSVCVDEPRSREVVDLITILKTEFKVLYNDKLTLTTIRHYTDKSLLKHTSGRKVYMEQRSRSTVQVLTD